MAYEFKLEERASQPTLTVRDRVTREELPALFDRAFSSVIQRMGELGEEPTGLAFAYYHDLDDMENPDIEAGFTVSRELEGDGDVKASTLPGGRYCTTLHVGPYEQLPEAWGAALDHVNAQGLALNEYAVEFYITDPREVPPEEYETEIALPLK